MRYDTSQRPTKSIRNLPRLTINERLQIERFVRGLHLRMIGVRALERVGLCLLVACGVLLVLMPIRISRSEETGTLLWAALGLAGVVGAAWGMVSRPGELAAAMEA